MAALGQNFAVFRGEKSNEAHILDAYCSHLGADLTSGGKVIGDLIQCPFHNWQFDGNTGDCVRGCSEKVKSSASIRRWHCTEVNGMIMVWYHAEEDLPPEWYPCPIEEVNQGLWTYQGRNEYHVTCHLQDIPENGAGMRLCILVRVIDTLQSTRKKGEPYNHIPYKTIYPIKM